MMCGQRQWESKNKDLRELMETLLVESHHKVYREEIMMEMMVLMAFRHSSKRVKTRHKMKQLVNQYALGADETRFGVVSYNESATTRVGWSTDADAINAGIDAMEADGKTSISAGLEAAGKLFDADEVGLYSDSRKAKKIVLLVADGEQSEELGGDTAAIDAAKVIKGNGATVFAWGFGDRLQRDTLVAIAGDESRVRYTDDVSELFDFLAALLADVCNDPPPN